MSVKSKTAFDNPLHFYQMMSGAMATAKSAKAAYDSLSSASKTHQKEMSNFKTRGASSHREGKRSKSSNSRTSTAPAAVGGTLRGAKWNFGTAPDVGLGPGLRLSGHTYLCQVHQQESKVDTVHYLAPFTTSTSSWATSGGQTAGNGRALIALDPTIGSVDTDNIAIGVFSSNTALRELCRCFERFHFSKCRLIYTPADSSATTGAFAVGYENDPARAYVVAYANNLSTSGFTVPLNLPGSKSTSFWQPETFDARIAKAAKSEADLFYCDSLYILETATVGTTNADLGALAQNRQTTQGMFMGFTTASPSGDVVNHGFITVEFVIDLYCTNFFTTGVAEPDPYSRLGVCSEFDFQLRRSRRETDRLCHELKGLSLEGSSRSLVREERKDDGKTTSGVQESEQAKPAVFATSQKLAAEPGWIELRSPTGFRRQ
jgi:hypothetical protein